MRKVGARVNMCLYMHCANSTFVPHSPKFRRGYNKGNWRSEVQNITIINKEEVRVQHGESFSLSYTQAVQFRLKRN